MQQHPRPLIIPSIVVDYNEGAYFPGTVFDIEFILDTAATITTVCYLKHLSKYTNAMLLHHSPELVGYLGFVSQRSEFDPKERYLH